MTPLLSFDQVTLSRGGRTLVEGLDLGLAPGERVHVTGANGSGKSSLLRLAAGLLRADRGRVERAPAALADDHPALDRELPLGAALGFWARLGGSPGRVGEALAALGLERLAEVPVRLLSAGQLKRAALARVLASSAPLWLLDEPLNGLDSSGLQRIAGVFDGHCAAGGAVLAASHVALPGQWRQVALGR